MSLSVIDTAEYYGVPIKYTPDLPTNVQGVLVSVGDTTLILVNSSYPLAEQRFTIAHELGHYVLHGRPVRPIERHWIFRHRWRSPRLQRIFRFWRRATCRWLTVERDADAWAMCLLISLGDREALRANLARHPQNFGLFFSVSLAMNWNRLKRSAFGAI